MQDTNCSSILKIFSLQPHFKYFTFFHLQAACTAVAVLRHFFQTAVFTWMLVEAVNLFIKLVKVISTETFYMTYLTIGWGGSKKRPFL